MTTDDKLARFRALGRELVAADCMAWHPSAEMAARDDARADAGEEVLALCDEIEREQREALYPDAVHWQIAASGWADDARAAYERGEHGYANYAQYNASQRYARARRLLGIEEP